MITTHVSVRELYEAIWHTPLKQLASQWQLHPHALAQLLDRHRIPRPPNGFWTQKSLGRSVTVIPLPASFSGHEHIDLTALQATRREKAKLEAYPLPPPNKSLSRYPLLKGIKGSLNKPTFEYAFLLTQRWDDFSVLQLDVSREQRDRGIAILHTLMSVFETRGWQVKVKKHRYAKRLVNVVTIDGEDVPFRLRERLVQRVRPLSPKELAEKARNGYVWHEKINVPSGTLQVIIDVSTPKGTRSVFEDTPGLSVENQLGHVLEALTCTAEHLRIQALERAAEHQRWAVAQAQQAERVHRIGEERRRMDNLLGAADQWQRVRQYRRFIRLVQRSPAFISLSQDDKAQFLRWADVVVKQVDPFRNGDLDALLSAPRETDNIVADALRTATAPPKR